MNFANPHFFSAILDGIGHRFILIQESESVTGSESDMPRFSVAGVNAIKDPRLAPIQNLIEVGVNDSSFQIPPGNLMAHQYIYIVHDNTDENGWQYRSKYSEGPMNAKDEPWSRSPLASSMVRRRIWMTTIVSKIDLTLAKRMLSDNIRVENGGYRMQGELLRYEKGTLSKSWQKRRVALASNRIEFYSGNTKKGEVPLNDCEVKMLFESQCPGKNFAFSIRNPMGNVGILLDAENKEQRKNWVAAIQYQLAINSHEMNFPPLEYAPPTGQEVDNRVLLCGDLMLQGKDSEGNPVWSPRHFQLLPREISYYEEGVMMGRIFVDGAKINGDSKNLNFQIESASGIVLQLSADTPDAKNLWLMGVHRQIQALANQRLKIENTPKEELQDPPNVTAEDRIALYRDDKWKAPKVADAGEQYYQMVLSAPVQNNPKRSEFTELVAAGDLNMRNDFHAEKKNEAAESNEETFEEENEDGTKTAGEKRHSQSVKQSAEVKGYQEVKNTMSADGRTAMQSQTQSHSTSMQQTAQQSSSKVTRVTSGDYNNNQQDATQLQLQVPISEPIAINPRRSLINPKFILTVLKGVTHRFLLAMECETRILPKRSSLSPKGYVANEHSSLQATNELLTRFPPRFTVGGPRASKDPRSTPMDELIEITSQRPEIQLPPGWVMMHQYVMVIVPNTDDEGWQYRSNWVEGGATALTPKDEQWVEKFKPDIHHVRRRLWMTTVVKRHEVMTAKRLVHEGLNANAQKKDIIMQGNLYRYYSELGQSSTSWQRRKVLMYHNKLEFFIGNERKGEAELEGCTVRMLFNNQCPGRSFVFSIRNATGTVNVLLDAETEDARLTWVRTIYYQISVLTPDVNYAPFEYGPPSGELPPNRVLLCGDLTKDGAPMHFQLKHFQLFYTQKGSDKPFGRLNLEGASMTSVKDESEADFAVRFKSGFVLNVTAESPDTKLAWVRAIRRQVTRIENEKNAAPGEEAIDDGLTEQERFVRNHEPLWTAPYADEEMEEEWLKSEREKLESAMRVELWDGEEHPIGYTIFRPKSWSVAKRFGPGNSGNMMTINRVGSSGDRGSGRFTNSVTEESHQSQQSESKTSENTSTVQQSASTSGGISPNSASLISRQGQAESASQSASSTSKTVANTSTSKVTSSTTKTTSSSSSASNNFTSTAGIPSFAGGNQSAAMAQIQQQQQQAFMQRAMQPPPTMGMGSMNLNMTMPSSINTNNGSNVSAASAGGAPPSLITGSGTTPRTFQKIVPRIEEPDSD